MLRRTARKRKAKGQEITLPRNATTRAEILATGHQTQTSMTRPPTFSTAMSTSGPIPYTTNVGSVTSLHLGANDATASQQSSTSADTHTVSSHTHLTDNNVPIQNADRYNSTMPTRDEDSTYDTISMSTVSKMPDDQADYSEVL